MITLLFLFITSANCISVVSASYLLEKKIRLRWRRYKLSEIKNEHARACTKNCAPDKSTCGSVKSTYVHD